MKSKSRFANPSAPLYAQANAHRKLQNANHHFGLSAGDRHTYDSGRPSRAFSFSNASLPAAHWSSRVPRPGCFARKASSITTYSDSPTCRSSPRSANAVSPSMEISALSNVDYSPPIFSNLLIASPTACRLACVYRINIAPVECRVIIFSMCGGTPRSAR